MKMWLVLGTAFAVLLSCSTLDQNVRPNYKIVDHKGVLAGAKVPAVIRDATIQPTEALSRKYFPDSYVFVANKTGRNLDGLMIWSNNFEVQAEVAKRIQTSVDFAASNSVGGNKDSVETTMDIATALIAQEKISGLQMQQDWWIKLEYEDGQNTYQYVAVYAIKKSLLDKFMQDAITKAEAQQNLDDEDKAAVAQLRQELSASAYGLEEGGGDLDETAFGPGVAESSE